MTFKDFIDGCTRELQSPSLEIVFTTAWDVWNARNEMFWDGKVTGVSEICQRAAGYAIDFMEAGLRVSSMCAASGSSVLPKWKAPAQGRYKMNIAVSFRSVAKVMGVGVLIRDCKGLVMTAFCTCFLVCGDVLHDQARVVMVGIQHALEIGILQVQVEVESCFQQLTGLINSGPLCLAAIGVLVDDICRFSHMF